MEIIIVRHGLSEANKARQVSYPDAPLAEEGKQQARELADRLKGLKIEAVYSSTMRRALDTAKPIANHLKVSIISDERLGEVRFGELEGMADSDAREILKGREIRDIFDTYKYDFSQWGGETSGQVEERVKSFLADLKKQPYQLVLVVCHGGIVRWFHYLLTGEKISWQPNAEELYLKT